MVVSVFVREYAPACVFSTIYLFLNPLCNSKHGDIHT